MIISQGVGLAGTLVLLALSGEPLPAPGALAFAAAAGASGVTGLGFFYYALSRGTMSESASTASPFMSMSSFMRSDFLKSR